MATNAAETKNAPKIRCSYTRLEAASKLKANPRNPNKHPDSQLDLYAKVIAHQGWRRAVVVSKRSGFIVTGHGAVECAKRAGWPKVPVDYQDFASAEDETAHMLADNRLPELAEMSQAELAAILSELKESEFEMALTGFDGAGLDQALSCLASNELDAEPQIDKAAQLQKKWKTKRGQIWQLGEHRLCCGDSTKKEDVDGLLDKETPVLMVTDPPYGVDYDANWRNEYQKSIGETPTYKRSVGKVECDSRIDWSAAYVLFPGDVAYIWHADRYASEVQRSIETAGFKIRCQIIWAKNRFNFGRGDYHWQHEPCWYAVRGNGHWQGDRSQTTLWQIDRNHLNETGHSTQKPIECMARPIRNNSVVGGSVYEPFSGSGTTIIACENLKRRCYAMEISPAYVAVALQRWADATGKTPALL